MTVSDFLKQSVLLFDGSMGTYYNTLVHDMDAPCELANMENPQQIEEIHKQYIASGAQAIKTNTFGANTVSLSAEWPKVEEVIRRGYQIACRAAAGNCYVFADIGPIPEKTDLQEYQKIADTFLALEASNFLFETFSEYQTVIEMSRYIKAKKPDAFILAQFAVSPDGYTRIGISGRTIMEELSAVWQVDAFGFNCLSGPSHLYRFVSQLNLPEKTISVMPNAGYPTVVNNRIYFDTSPAYFAQRMLDIKRCGVKILGGCCGTTPEHIRSVSELLKEDSGNVMQPKKKVLAETKQRDAVNPFEEKLKSNKKVCAVELDPPFDTNISRFMEAAGSLKLADMITVADCPIARARMDSSMLSAKIARELGKEAMPHLACRDRNINATKALLLGLNVESVRNVLVVTGDPIPQAERNEVRGVFQFNSVMLAEYIRELNETCFSANPFHIAAALNINAINFDAELTRAEKKVKAGVKTFLTQPVYTDEAVKNLALAKQQLEAYILGGIMPLVSYKNANFINNEVSGITIPQQIIECYRDKTPDESAELAVSLSYDMAGRIAPFVDGYYFMTPLNRVGIINRLLERMDANDRSR